MSNGEALDSIDEILAQADRNMVQLLNLLEHEWERPQSSLEAEIIKGLAWHVKAVRLVRERLRTLNEPIKEPSPEIRRVGGER